MERGRLERTPLTLPTGAAILGRHPAALLKENDGRGCGVLVKTLTVTVDKNWHCYMERTAISVCDSYSNEGESLKCADHEMLVPAESREFCKGDSSKRLPCLTRDGNMGNSCPILSRFESCQPRPLKLL